MATVGRVTVFTLAVVVVLAVRGVVEVSFGRENMLEIYRTIAFMVLVLPLAWLIVGRKR